MGLDLYFNKKQAIDAGLVLMTEPRYSAKEIAERRAAIGDCVDEGFFQWMAEQETYIKVPNANHLVAIWDGGDQLSVRANQWGPTYKPLTDWLRSHNITWVEA